MGKFFSKKKEQDAKSTHWLQDGRPRGRSEPIIPTQPSIVEPRRSLSLFSEQQVGNRIISILPESWTKKKETTDDGPYGHLTYSKLKKH